MEEPAGGKLIILDYACEYGICSHIIWHKDKRLSACQRDFLGFCGKVDAAGQSAD